MIPLIETKRSPLVEKISRRSALGVRFWDQARNAQIDPIDLRVTIRPADGTGREVSGVRTPSGICGFHLLPGLRGFEYGHEKSPPPRAFVLKVVDPRRRFVPYAHRLELPADRGAPYWSSLDAEEDELAPPGIYLFSSPSRAAAPDVALLQGELRNADTDEPAPFAVIEVEIADSLWFGIADERGCFSVRFPYPVPAMETGANESPEGEETEEEIDEESAETGEGAETGEERPAGVSVWPFSARIRFGFAPLDKLLDTDLPDQADLFDQPPADLQVEPTPEEGVASRVSEYTSTLRAGQPVVLKTQNNSRLLLHPPG